MLLAALAQDNRLDVFRLLVDAGPEGMPAGHIAARLRMSPNALTFHLDRLRTAPVVGPKSVCSPSAGLAFVTHNWDRANAGG
jgi:predicted ArsR family transcriptional regulator